MRLQRRRRHLPRRPADTEAGPDHHGVLAFVAEDFDQIRRVAHQREHDGGDMHRMDVERLGRCGDGDQPRADPKRRLSGETRRACMKMIARHADAMTGRVIVPCLGPQRHFPECRTVLGSHRTDFLEHVRRNADVAEHDLAAMVAARHQNMPGLLAEKGDGQRRADGDAPHRPGRSVDTARNVDRDDR